MASKQPDVFSKFLYILNISCFFYFRIFNNQGAKPRPFVYLIHSFSQHLWITIFVWGTMPGTADLVGYEIDLNSVLMFYSVGPRNNYFLLALILGQKCVVDIKYPDLNPLYCSSWRKVKNLCEPLPIEI